jgi:predicted CXXCH cytochrome family protein
LRSEFKSSPTTHVVRIALILAGAVAVGVFVRPHLLPEDFGKYGHYRPGALEDEANRTAKFMTAESCLECHSLIRQLHVDSTHKTVSCEICHGAHASHVKDDQVVAAMRVVRGEDIRPLCIRCHNKLIQAREPKSIKLVALPDHLEKRKVRTDHICNQCHHVHAPLKWVHEARQAMGLPLDPEEN